MMTTRIESIPVVTPVLFGLLVLGGCAMCGPAGGEPDPVPPPTADIAVMSEPEPAAADPSPPTVFVPMEPATPTLEPFEQKLSRTALAFDMVPVPAGTVTIDGKTHDVPAFWAAKTETAWELYDVFVFESDKNAAGAPEPEADAVTRPSRPYVSPDRGFGHRGYAAISLAHQGAEQYCVWLSAKTGRKYRLPTEIEWRYLCSRSGITPESADEFAWHEGNAEWTPHPIGKKKADAGGLHDLWGNVREWAVGIDGQPVALGGSFQDPLDEVGCAGRHVPNPRWQETDPQLPKSPWWLSDAPFMGCRVVCVPGE